MIDFRYHVVSIVAVFLALTVGLVLGASFLSKYAVDGLKENITSLTSQKNNLQQENRNQSNTLDGLNSYVNDTAATLVSGYLDGDDVTIVQIAGLDGPSTAATINLLGVAGATVTSNITLNPAFTDPTNNAALTQAVTANLPPGQTAVGSTPQLQAANLLAEVLTAPDASTDDISIGQVNPPPSGMSMADAIVALKNFAAAGLITINTLPSATETVRPNLAFLAAPIAANTADENTAYLTLAEALRTNNAEPVIGGSAVGGGAGSSQSGGLLYATLNDSTAFKEISTVDNINLTMGQVAVVFALYQNVNTPGPVAGHYGAIGGTDGQLPAKLPLRPSPVPTATGTGTARSGGRPSGATPSSGPSGSATPGH